MNELRARGVEDVLVVVCDGLVGLPDAITAVWPQATVQTCIVHLTRASLRWVNYKDRKKVAAALGLTQVAMARRPTPPTPIQPTGRPLGPPTPRPQQPEPK